ncbi:hypothetical protein Cal7507_1328 [Calothrix sp. PCC 7507]|nr:hypothetical protein Cal7507_1328 [Calothrix sp. PCC 7507]
MQFTTAELRRLTGTLDLEAALELFQSITENLEVKIVSEV